MSSASIFSRASDSGASSITTGGLSRSSVVDVGDVEALERRGRRRRSPRRRGGRLGQEHRGRVVLLEHAALSEDCDSVAQLHCLLDVVGDEHDRLVHLGLEPQELVLETLPGDGVDGAERLVHEQHRAGRRRGPEPLRPAAAGRPRVGRGSGPRTRRRARPTSSSSSFTRARIRRRSQPSRRGTVPTLSATVRWGNRPTCWIT